MSKVRFIGLDVHAESCLMQDEPGAKACFSYKMSLEGAKSGMLGVDHQNAGRGTDEPGTDPGVSGSQ